LITATALHEIVNIFYVMRRNQTA